ncbi:MAG: hypothetical protein R8K20_05640, partial [Gallionellaceae bacterium]
MARDFSDGLLVIMALTLGLFSLTADAAVKQGQTFNAWTVSCEQVEADGKTKDYCLIYQDALSEDKKPVVSMAIGF